MKRSTLTTQEISKTDFSGLTEEELDTINRISTITADISRKIHAELMNMTEHKKKTQQITVEEIESLPVTSTFDQLKVIRKRVNKERDIFKRYLLSMALRERSVIILKDKVEKAEKDFKNKLRIKKLESVLCEQKPKQSLLKKLINLISQRCPQNKLEPQES